MTTLSLFDGLRPATPPAPARSPVDRALPYYPTPCYIAEAFVERHIRQST